MTSIPNSNLIGSNVVPIDQIINKIVATAARPSVKTQEISLSPLFEKLYMQMFPDSSLAQDFKSQQDMLLLYAQQQATQFFIEMNSSTVRYDSIDRNTDKDTYLTSDYLRTSHIPEPHVYSQLINMINFNLLPTCDMNVDKCIQVLISPQTNESIRVLLMQYLMNNYVYIQLPPLFSQLLFQNLVDSLNPALFKGEYERSIIPLVMIMPLLFNKMKQQVDADKLLRGLELILKSINRNVLKMFYCTSLCQLMKYPELRPKLSFVTNRINIFTSWFRNQKHQSATYLLFAEYSLLNKQFMNTSDFNKFFTNFQDDAAKCLPAFVRLASSVCFNNEIFDTTLSDRVQISIISLNNINTSDDQFKKYLNMFVTMINKISVNWKMINSICKDFYLFQYDQSHCSTYLNGNYIRTIYYIIHPYVCLLDDYNVLNMELFDIIKLFIHQCPEYFVNLLDQTQKLLEREWKISQNTQIIILLALTSLEDNYYENVIQSFFAREYIIKNQSIIQMLFNGIFQKPFNGKIAQMLFNQIDFLQFDKPLQQKCLQWLCSCIDEDMIISLRVFQNILKRLRTDFGSENQIVLVQSELVKRFSSLLQNEFVIQEDTIYFDALILAYSLTIFSSANDSIITNNKNIFCLYCKVTKFSYLKEYNFELIMCDRRQVIHLTTELIQLFDTTNVSEEGIKFNDRFHQIIFHTSMTNITTEKKFGIISANRILYQLNLIPGVLSFPVHRVEEMNCYVMSLSEDYYNKTSTQFYEFLDFLSIMKYNSVKQIVMGQSMTVQQCSKYLYSLSTIFDNDSYQKQFVSIDVDHQMKHDYYYSTILHYFTNNNMKSIQDFPIGLIIRISQGTDYLLQSIQHEPHEFIIGLQQQCDLKTYVTVFGSYSMITLVYLFNIINLSTIKDIFCLQIITLGIINILNNFTTLYQNSFKVIGRLQINTKTHIDKGFNLFSSQYPNNSSYIQQKNKQDFIKNIICINCTDKTRILERTFGVLSFLLCDEFQVKLDEVFKSLDTDNLKITANLYSSNIFQKTRLSLLQALQTFRHNRMVVQFLYNIDDNYIQVLNNSDIIQNSDISKFNPIEKGYSSQIIEENYSRFQKLSQFSYEYQQNNIKLPDIHKMAIQFQVKQYQTLHLQEYLQEIFSQYLLNIQTFDDLTNYLTYILEFEELSKTKSVTEQTSTKMIDSKLENSIKEMNDPIEYQFTEKQLHIISSISKAEAAFNSQQKQNIYTSWSIEQIVKYQALQSLLSLVKQQRMNIIVNPDYPITLNLDTLFYEEETSDSKEVVILFSLARSIFNICCQYKGFKKEYFIKIRNRFQYSNRVNRALSISLQESSANSYYFASAFISIALLFSQSQTSLLQETGQQIIELLKNNKSFPQQWQDLFKQYYKFKLHEIQSTNNFIDEVLKHSSIFAPGQFWFIQNLSPNVFQRAQPVINKTIAYFISSEINFDIPKQFNFVPRCVSTVDSESSQFSRKEISNDCTLDLDIKKQTPELTDFFMHSLLQMLSQMICSGKSSITTIINKFQTEIYNLSNQQTIFDSLIIKLLMFYTNNTNFIKMFKVEQIQTKSFAHSNSKSKSRPKRIQTPTQRTGISLGFGQPKDPSIEKQLSFLDESEIYHCCFDLQVVEQIFISMCCEQNKYQQVVDTLFRFFQQRTYLNLYEAAANFNSNKATEFLYGLAVRQILAHILCHQSQEQNFLCLSNHQLVARILSQLLTIGIYSGIHSKSVIESPSQSTKDSSSSCLSQLQRLRAARTAHPSSARDETILTECLDIQLGNYQFLNEISTESMNDEQGFYYEFLIAFLYVKMKIRSEQEFEIVSKFVYQLLINTLYVAFDNSFVTMSYDTPPWQKSLFYTQIIEVSTTDNKKTEMLLYKQKQTDCFSSEPIIDLPPLRNNHILKIIDQRLSLIEAINQFLLFMIKSNKLEPRLCFDLTQTKIIVRVVISLYTNHLFLTNNNPCEQLIFKAQEQFMSIFVRLVILSILPYQWDQLGKQGQQIPQIQFLLRDFEDMFDIFQVNQLSLPILSETIQFKGNQTIKVFGQLTRIQNHVQKYNIYQHCQFQEQCTKLNMQQYRVITETTNTLDQRQIETLTKYSKTQQNIASITFDTLVQNRYIYLFQHQQKSPNIITSSNYASSQLKELFSIARFEDDEQMLQNIQQIYSKLSDMQPAIYQPFQQYVLQLTQTEKLALNAIQLIQLLMIVATQKQQIAGFIKNFVLMIDDSEDSKLVQTIINQLIKSEQNNPIDPPKSLCHFFNEIITIVNERDQLAVFMKVLNTYAIHSSNHQIPSLLLIALTITNFQSDRRVKECFSLYLLRKSKNKFSNLGQRMLNKVYQYGNNMVLTDNSDEGVEFILQKANEKYGMDKNLIE